tara:strand:+ start:21289 stop:21489 length:201 start_codon:yes stop_codon:yes gene_type:complete
MIRVEGHKNLYRDEDSGAIINHDTNGYSEYIKMRDLKRSQKDEIDKLKNEITEIKSLLKELVNNSN